MARMNQLVGIIEIDADPDLAAPSDGTLMQTLTQLSRGESDCQTDSFFLDSDGPMDDGEELDSSDTIMVLKADLLQLQFELECELAALLDRLFQPNRPK